MSFMTRFVLSMMNSLRPPSYPGKGMRAKGGQKGIGGKKGEWDNERRMKETRRVQWQEGKEVFTVNQGG